MNLKFFCIQYYIKQFNKYPNQVLTLKGIYNYEVQNYNSEILILQNKIINFKKIDKTKLYNLEDIHNYRIKYKKFFIIDDLIDNYIDDDAYNINKSNYFKYLHIILEKIFLNDNNYNYIIEELYDEYYKDFIIYFINRILKLISNKKIKYLLNDQGQEWTTYSNDGKPYNYLKLISKLSIKYKN